MTLGKYLRKLRVMHYGEYMTLRDAAKLAGCSVIEWSHYESDRERPSKDFLRHIWPLFGADLEEMFRLWSEWVEAPPPDLSQAAFVCRRPL